MNLFLLAFMFFFTLLHGYDDTVLTTYRAAETANTQNERQALFNKALHEYLVIQDSSASLQYNIANCYAQLGEYGLAILYYYRALHKNPRFEKAQVNLQITAQKIDLHLENREPSFPLSSLELKLCCLGAAAAGFLFFSLYLWTRHSLLRQLGILALLTAVIFFVLIAWMQWFSHIDAVIIAPTQLKKDTGVQYTPISTKDPLYGQRVRVMEIMPDGLWLKIKTSNGEEGYVSKEQARII